jgi:acyl-coenzyme A thioesterase PaaI-like protein
MVDTTPAGFKVITTAQGFIGLNGPYYWRRDADGRLEFGFQTDARHANPNGVLHGGAVLGFLDTILGHAIVDETRKRCATIALDSRFIAAISTSAEPRAPGPQAAPSGLARTLRCIGFSGRRSLEDEAHEWH